MNYLFKKTARDSNNRDTNNNDARGEEEKEEERLTDDEELEETDLRTGTTAPSNMMSPHGRDRKKKKKKEPEETVAPSTVTPRKKRESRASTSGVGVAAIGAAAGLVAAVPLQHDETTPYQQASGAYAVRGDEIVARSGQQLEDMSLVSSETTATTPAAAPTGTTDTTDDNDTRLPVVVEAELVSRNAEDRERDMQERMERLEILMEQQRSLAVAHAQPMPDDVESRSDEPETRDTAPPQSSHTINTFSEDAPEEQAMKEKKKRTRLIVLGVVIVLVITVVAVAASVASNGGGGGSKANGIDNNNAAIPTDTPTVYPMASPIATTSSPVTVVEPTTSPTSAPTPLPTRMPTRSPTRFPTRFPTTAPISTNPPLPNGPFLQLGQDLNGKAEDDRFGHSVCLSADGNVVAVGASQSTFSTRPGRPGYVSVFQNNTQSEAWMPMGQDLVGSANEDRFGRSVSLNGNGSILAVGATRNDQGGDRAGLVAVYEYNTDSATWNQLGGNIVGQGAGDRFGRSVSLSDAGDVLAVGAPDDNTSNGHDSGSVRLFRFNRGTASWDPMGQTLIGQAAVDSFGISVSLSHSGTVVAFGAYRNDSGGRSSGQVSVFQFNSASSTWVPMGEPILGQVVDGWLGLSVALDASGLVLAVGAPGIGVDVPEKVLVFEFDSAGSTWTQRGQTLENTDRNEDFGTSVWLSHDGTVLAVGVRGADPNGLSNAGQVRIYQYSAGTKKWNLVVENLNGNASGDYFGESVSLSGDGTVVGSGAVFGLDGAGYAKVFALN